MSRVWVRNPNGTGGFYSCECIRDIWPLVNELARQKGIVKYHLDVSQGSYTTAFRGSGNTHGGGGVLDIWQTGQALDDMLEEAGFADYERDRRDGFAVHSHIIYRNCPHLHPSAAAQVTSWWNRRNGLVNNRLDRDQTRPPRRTVAQIHEWLNSQINRVNASSAVTRANAARLANTVGKGRPISFSHTMSSLGKPNGNVKIIQRILARQKPDKKTPLYDGPIDGVYGPKTKEAVKHYQQIAYKTTDTRIADGILGWDSFSRLARWDGWKPVK